jgi:plastocyanin
MHLDWKIKVHKSLLITLLAGFALVFSACQPTAAEPTTPTVPLATSPVLTETVGAPTVMAPETAMPTAILPDTGATPTAEIVPSVEVSDQEIEEGTVTIDRVQSIGPGWIVIHADDAGAPGPVIGHAPVEDLSENVTVDIDVENATGTLHAMLHEDAGTAGEYEFPGADVPVQVDGQVVNVPFTVTGGLDEDDSGEVAEENILEVNVEGLTFQPEELTVPSGTTVVWNHTGTLPHTVTAVDGSFDSGTLQAGDTFEWTFDEPGRHEYYCQFHGSQNGTGMFGVILVESP